MPNKRTNIIEFEFEKNFAIGYCVGSNQPFIFDIDDYNKIKSYVWTLGKNQWGGYVHARIDGKWQYLHRFIMSAKKGQYVDHINQNRLDNTKLNLRICTNMQNSYNHKIKLPKGQEIVGVPYSKKYKVWMPNIRINGKRINLGWCKNQQNAIINRLKAEKQYYGEFAPQKHLFEKYEV